MRNMKVLGLTVACAAVAMCALSAGTASASTLCKTTVDPCPGGWDYPAGTEFQANLVAGNSLIFEVSGITEDTCTVSTIRGKTSNTGSSTSTVEGAISTLTFEKCTNTTKLLANGSLEFHADNGGSGSGIVTGKGSEVTVVAFGSITCVLDTGTGTFLGTIDEPASATSDAILTINATLKVTNFLCPTTVQWTAEYTITSPKPFYVVPDVG